MPDATVKAAWVGGFPVHYAPEDRVLQPGDVADVPADEAAESEHWAPVDKPSKKASPKAEEADV